MKITFIFPIFIAILVVIAAYSLSSGLNVPFTTSTISIPNPSFENSDGSKPLDWYYGNENSDFSWDSRVFSLSDAAYNGSKSLLFNLSYASPCAYDNSCPSFNLLTVKSKKIGVSSNTLYTLDFYAKPNLTGNIGISDAVDVFVYEYSGDKVLLYHVVQFNNTHAYNTGNVDQFQSINYADAENGWKHVTVKFRTTTKTDTIRIFISMDNFNYKGLVNFDSFHLGE